MKKFLISLLVGLVIVGASFLLALYIRAYPVPVLQPKGLIGNQERDLMIVCALLMLIIVVPVLILTFVFAWGYRASNQKAKYSPNWEHHHVAELCWWGLPFVIIVILAIITWKTSHDLDPFKPIQGDQKPLTVQVVALNWKWLFIYPEEGIATVNTLRFPEKTPIYFQITADAPMNSFWIPQLGGQIYAMSGMRSELYLLADEIGKYSGRSANISGKGFAKMVFTAQSTSLADFEHWVQEVKASQESLTRESYTRLSQPSEPTSASYYLLADQGLFDWIMRKYTAPKQRLGKKDVTWKAN